MHSHQNSTIPGETLKHISELKETVYDFHFTPEQQEQISQLFWESLVYECDTIFEADELGAFTFDEKQWSLETVILDFGDFFDSVTKNFEEFIKGQTKITETEILLWLTPLKSPYFTNLSNFLG